jgi:hypothetical protein
LASPAAPLALPPGSMALLETSLVREVAEVQIVVTELAIEDAVGRARRHFREADERLSQALAGSVHGLPWLALGILVIAAGAFLHMGAFALPAEAARMSAAGLFVLGGSFLGYGVPLWARARRQTRRCAREWQHALAMLRLREQQAADDPDLTVEVLERIDGAHALPPSAWRRPTGAGSRYVQ